MTIQQLIEILHQSPDKNAKVWIESKTTDFTNNIYISFDDLNDIQLYEIAASNNLED